MKIKLLTGIMAMTALLGIGLQPAWADEEYGHGKGYRSGYGGHMMGGRHATTGHLLRGLLGSQKEMGLTDEQVTKLKAIQLDLDKTRIKAEADIMLAERELQALLENEKSELSTVEEKVKQSESLEVGLRMAAIKARRDVMAVLTPEQSARIKAVHDKMMQQYREQKMGEGKGHGMMKGGGHPKGEAKKGDEKKEPKP